MFATVYAILVSDVFLRCAFRTLVPFEGRGVERGGARLTVSRVSFVSFLMTSNFKDMKHQRPNGLTEAKSNVRAQKVVNNINDIQHEYLYNYKYHKI